MHPLRHEEQAQQDNEEAQQLQEQPLTGLTGGIKGQLNFELERE
jgi:hypothetical protein